MPCLMCGRPASEHSYNTRRICNVWFFPEEFDYDDADQRCRKNSVGAGGECVVCNAEQGEACQQQMLPASNVEISR